MSGPMKRKKDETSGTDIFDPKQIVEDATLTMTHEDFAACLKFVSDENLVLILEKDHRLLPSVRLVIKKRYQYRYFKLSTDYDPRLATEKIPQTAKLLKHFGNEIKLLEIVYDEEHRCLEHFIEKEIMENCCQSLEALRVVNANQYSMLEIQPFPNITEIEFNTGTFGFPLKSIAIKFPLLETVKLLNLVLHEPLRHGFMSFNKLTVEIIEIENIQSKKGGTGHFDYVVQFICAHYKLEKLSIGNQDNLDELLKLVAERKPKWPQLQFKLNLNKPIGTESIHFEELKCLWITGLDQELKISVDHLEELCLVDDSFTINALKFIQNCRNVKMFHLQSQWENDHVVAEFIKSLKTWPNLRELALCATLSIAQIYDLVQNCKELKKVTLPETNEDYNEEEFEEELKGIFSIIDPAWKFIGWNMSSKVGIFGLLFEKSNAAIN